MVVELMSRLFTGKTLGRKLHREAGRSMLWVCQEWYRVSFYRLVQTLMFSIGNYRGLDDWQNYDQGKFSVRKISSRTSAALTSGWFIFNPLKFTTDRVLTSLEWCTKELMDRAERICSRQETLSQLTRNRKGCPVVITCSSNGGRALISDRILLWDLN